MERVLWNHQVFASLSAVFVPCEVGAGGEGAALEQQRV